MMEQKKIKCECGRTYTSPHHFQVHKRLCEEKKEADERRRKNGNEKGNRG